MPKAQPAPTLSSQAANEIGTALRTLLADVFALYLKTKNFHWHIAGPHFRDYHLLLDEHADQIFAMTDDIAERNRKLGVPAIHSIGQISKLQRVKDNDAAEVNATAMLKELREDNIALAAELRAAHELCDEHGDVATTSLIENWVDQTERRAWFLTQTVKG